MSDVKQQVQDALTRFIKDRVTVSVFPAKVKTYQEDFNTVDIVDGDGIEIFDVMLSGDLGFGVSLLMKPVVGSNVIVADIGDSGTRHVVIAVSQIENIKVTIDTTSVEITNAGVSISHAGDNLKSIINDLINQIKLITVTSSAPGSPTSTPLNFAAFDVITTRVNNLLNA